MIETNNPTDSLSQLGLRAELLGVNRQLNALTRIWDTLERTVADWFYENNFVKVNVPHLSDVVGACESFDTLYTLDYHGRTGYLNQTSQSHLEMFVRGFPKVWTYTWSSRAETKYPERRATLFRMAEYEMAGATLIDVQGVQERLLYTVCDALLQHNYADMLSLNVDMSNMVGVMDKPHFPRISYDKAIDVLHASTVNIEWGEDLRAEHERVLWEHMGEPFFLTHFPKSIKYFSMRTCKDNPLLCESSDLILPNVGEVAGASEREYDYDSLAASLTDYANDPKRKEDIKRVGIETPEALIAAYGWYTALRKGENATRSGGSGIGLERVLMWALGRDRILDVQLIPRGMNNLIP
jgi:asparaginyl-tRNA synthetase